MAATKQLLTDLASTIKHVPSNYVRPVSERPNLSDVQNSGVSIPLIDLQGLDGPNHSEIIKQIAHACQHYGFFQVKNHGVPEAAINKMLSAGKEFFQLPESERLKNCSDDHYKSNVLSTSFNASTENVASWRDFLRIYCFPVEEHMHQWPSNPPTFREAVVEYSTNVKVLALKLLEAISESLGLKKDHVAKTLGKHVQHMVFNYYPPCPEPELTYGLPGHSDPNAITILLTDDVPGLHVLKDGKWIVVNSIPNTFIINIAEQMQVISNDRYKSVLHRAVTNCDRARLSIPTFYSPSPEALIGPAEELVDDESPAVYKSFTYAEFFKKFWDRGLNTTSGLDFFKTSTS